MAPHRSTGEAGAGASNPPSHSTIIVESRYDRRMAMNAEAVKAWDDDRTGRAAVFHALSEPTRLALLEHLASGEHRVRDLVKHMHLAQSTVSKHLSCLRDCGLVQMRSEGRASWFSLAQPRLLKKVLKAADYLAAASGSHPSLREHLARDQRNENGE